MDLNSNTVIIGGTKIPLIKASHISDENLQAVINSAKFKDWANSLDVKSIEIQQLQILNVFMFGKIVGFVDLVLDATLSTSKNKVKIPGFVFLRGGAVAMLMVLNKEFIIVTKQFRVPAGKFLIEAPAGMLDESGDFKGVAAKEIEEECGIHINSKELKDLGYIHTSPGGSDEKLHIFSIDVTLADEELKNVLEKIHGEEHEGESIEIKLIKFNKKEILATNDAKLISAAFAYETLNNITIKWE
jgi:ADP-sugar diphosphatase